MRLEFLLKGKKLDLGGVRHLVFDEADKLFDLKFAEQVDAAIAACSHRDVVRNSLSDSGACRLREAAPCEWKM